MKEAASLVVARERSYETADSLKRVSTVQQHTTVVASE